MGLTVNFAHDIQARNFHAHPELDLSRCFGHAIGVVADCDLETPSSFVEDMMATWALHLGLTEGREAEIRNIVVRVVSENIPKEMRDCL